MSKYCYLLSFFLYPLLIQADATCAAEDGVCTLTNDEASHPPPACRTVVLSFVHDIYSNGGSAQAYKPHQPEKNEICNPLLYESSRYRTATWPFFSFSSSARPPQLNLTIQPWRCEESTCCEWQNSNVTLEIWQTRPDGTYSSLRPGQQEGDCRARQQGNTLTFTTVAPGSTGSLGGLGPYGYDLAPYGPPVLHILAQHPGMEPLLLNLPILTQRTTLESKPFHYSDWRGAAWTQPQVDVAPYHIALWEPNIAENSIDIHLDVYLQPQKDRVFLTKKLCRSWIYGLPSSFFVEPISVCAASMLDFFAL
ncbi:hypothetical protein FisN_6Lh115 [Fistulifera solaris]|uniref:Uncharacterized protein n=1 Tax=Fistulifera solaris TaxID=1519565 RepID=A0A1Z5J668_FISSO|nr:hypothetical protein FisN_6Lh115 [Fistulifera solaris]|eukprot:GAX09497.1 hypothetical protein FisN_6Lh115 [Fistulifera solaris]